MKRTLLALALAAVGTGSAFAQSSVNIYGRLNVTAESLDKGGLKTKELVNNASRIGFKGTEDLGGGLKAGFVLEHGFNPDTGTAASSFWGRQSEVNLSGAFGTVRLGNFTSEAYFATADYISMHNHDTGNSEDKLYAYLGRNGNKLAYRTPSLGAVTAEIAISLAEATGRFRTYDVAVNYGAGPLHIGLGYEKADRAKQLAVSALYEMGPLVLGAMVQRDTDGYGAGLGNRTYFRGSVAYNFGANELHLNYGKAGEYSKLKQTDATQLTLGYNYNLSKRTKLFGFYTKVDNDASNRLIYGPTATKDFSSLAAGVRHNF
jgi:predicted porin